MEDQSNNNLVEATRSDERAHGFAHKEIRQILIVCAAWVWVLVMGTLWSVETWQRPWITRVPDERIWLGLACLGLLGLMVFPLRWRSPARFVRRVVLVVAGGALLLGGLRVYCEELAVGKLESMLEEEISLHMEQLKGGLHVPSDTLVKKLHDALESTGVGSPKWLADRARSGESKPIKPTHGFVARSRLPVRLRMADAMVRDAKKANYLMAFWREYFPAFTGQDVTLECRRALLLQLDAMRKEPGHPLPTRQACLLVMALIVLTDPPEFESWRVPVRDAMIGLREPVVNPWTGQSQDFWYRALDALLALDPPESWSMLARPMVVEGEAFLQAMRVPVRGLTGNFDAFLPIFENCPEPKEQFYVWQSAGASLEDHPEAFDVRTAEAIRNWRRDILFRWLMALGDGSRYDLTQRAIPALPILDHYPVPPLLESQQEQLVSAAESWVGAIQQTPGGDEEKVAAGLDRIRHIFPYLNEKNADALCQSLIPILLQPERFAEKKRRGYTFDDAWANCLWFGRSRMTHEQQLFLRDRLVPLMENLSMMDQSHQTMLYIDAWSEYPALSREHWLALALSRGRLWATRPKDLVHYTRPSDYQVVYSVPEFSEQDIDSMIGHLAFALQPQADKTFEEILSERLQVKSGTIKNTMFIGRMRMRMKQLGMHSVANPEWLRNVLKTELAEIGLCPVHGGITDFLMDRARSGKFSYGAFLYQPEMSDRFWGEALQNPERAGHEVISCFANGFHDEVLNSFIRSIERSSPEDAVIRAVWDALRARSHDGDNRRKVFGALFRISDRVEESERLAMRRDYMEAIHGGSLPDDMDDTGYHATVAHHVSISGASPIMSRDPNPLAYPGGGIGISWEDDALSAGESWRTMVDRQLYRQPIVNASSYRGEVFAYLSQGFESDNQIGGWKQPERGLLPALPFPPTPWQQARALYGKRPDLKF